jgi:hypothetical protein
MAATDSAGVVPQTNWNNASSTNPVVVSTTVAGGNANIDSPTAGSIVDNHGNATAASIQFLSTNPWAVSGTVPTAGDAKLMNGYLDNTAAATPTSVSLTNVPYAFYSVYAYVGSDTNGRVGHGQVNGGTPIYFTTNDNPFGGYVQATATTQAASVAATYMQFDNLGGSSVTYTEARDTANVGLHGLQIVEMTGSPVSLANAVVVTADSTIDLTGAATGAITGTLSIGNNTLSITGGSTGANAPYTLSVNTLNLTGSPTFSVANNGSGTGTLAIGTLNDGGTAQTITKTGSGTAEVDSLPSFTSGTVLQVNGGTLRFAASPAADTTFATGVSSNVAALGTLELQNNGSGKITYDGSLLSAGTLLKTGTGTAEISQAPTFSNGSQIQVNGGTLRFNVTSGTPFVGTGVVATVSNAASLELAGSVSALDPVVIKGRADVLNNSTAGAGLHVTGTNQQVGFVDGTGTTQVDAGSDLTANHIVQSALVIGGTATSPAVVTIDASDTNGNPLAATAASSSSLIAGTPGPSSLLSSGASSPGSSSLGLSSPALGVPSIGGSAAVPEPSTLVLISIGALVGMLAAVRGRRGRR